MFPSGSLFLPSRSFFLYLLSFRASERRALRSLLCLSSTLRSFVLFLGPLEGLIAAHTRSPFVSSFYHLFPTILPSCLNPSSILFLSSRPMHPNRLQSTTMRTAQRGGLRVIVLFFSRVPSLSDVLVYLCSSSRRLSSHPTSFSKRRGEPVIPSLFPFPRRNDHRFLRRVASSSSLAFSP